MAGLFEKLSASDSSTPETLLAEIHAQLRKSKSAARGCLVALDNRREDPIENITRRNVGSEIIWQRYGGTLLKLRRQVKAHGQKINVEGETVIIPTAHPQICIALTTDSTTFAARVLIPAVERSGPRLFLPRITSKALVTVLYHASRQKGLSNFAIRYVGAKSQIEKRTGPKLRSERMWTDESLDDVLNTLRERGQWIHTAEFDYQQTVDGKKVRAAGRFSRDCTFKVEGEFRWFLSNIIRPTTDEAVKVITFYSGRSRTETPSNAPRPIVIEYREAVFREKSKHVRLAQVLGKLANTSVSVFHANPYFRASLVDFTDGSSYEIWILSQHRIILTPQFRATSASMERVIDHILSGFGEGELRDFGEVVNA